MGGYNPITNSSSSHCGVIDWKSKVMGPGSVYRSKAPRARSIRYLTKPLLVVCCPTTSYLLRTLQASNSLRSSTNHIPPDPSHSTPPSPFLPSRPSAPNWPGDRYLQSSFSCSCSELAASSDLVRISWLSISVNRSSSPDTCASWKSNDMIESI